MKLLKVDRNVIAAQCKGSPLKLQFGYTAIWLLPGSIPGFTGSHFGLFIPRKTEKGYSRTGFQFRPYLWRDVPMGQVPQWYRKLTNALSFRIQ